MRTNAPRGRRPNQFIDAQLVWMDTLATTKASTMIKTMILITLSPIIKETRIGFLPNLNNNV